MKIDTDDLISVSDANRRGISRLVADAEAGHHQVIIRNNKPAAVIAGLDTLHRLNRIDEEEADLRLLTIALLRTVTDTGERYSLDDLLIRDGVTRAELQDDEG